MHFIHVNVNSLLSKTEELRDFVGPTKPAILGITESKLDSSASDQKVNISGYSIFRSGRNRYGGGVACYIRAYLWRCIFWFTYSKGQCISKFGLSQ